MKNIGLIAGRHPLPVEEYILQGEVSADPAHTKELAREIALGVCRTFGDDPSVCRETVRLYLTGLTRAALLVLEELRGRNLKIEVMEWNVQSGEYVHTLSLQGAWSPDYQDTWLAPV